MAISWWTGYVLPAPGRMHQQAKPPAKGAVPYPQQTPSLQGCLFYPIGFPGLQKKLTGVPVTKGQSLEKSFPGGKVVLSSYNHRPWEGGSQEKKKKNRGHKELQDSRTVPSVQEVVPKGSSIFQQAEDENRPH